jgi:hypothetical protein
MSEQAGVAGRVAVSGVLEYKDKDGNVIKTVEVSGSLPIQQGADDGVDDDSERSQESGA